MMYTTCRQHLFCYFLLALGLYVAKKKEKKRREHGRKCNVYCFVSDKACQFPTQIDNELTRGKSSSTMGWQRRLIGARPSRHSLLVQPQPADDHSARHFRPIGPREIREAIASHLLPWSSPSATLVPATWQTCKWSCQYPRGHTPHSPQPWK